jgi:hypothetical protein
MPHSHACTHTSTWRQAVTIPAHSATSRPISSTRNAFTLKVRNEPGVSSVSVGVSDTSDRSAKGCMYMCVCTFNVIVMCEVPSGQRKRRDPWPERAPSQ